MMLAAIVLPALLAPQVRSGQQLHYRTTWTRQLNGPRLAGSSPLQTQVAYTVTVSSGAPAPVSWTRKYTSGADSLFKFSTDASGHVVNSDNGKTASIPVFIYNSALLGQPPHTLRAGATWTNAIHHATADEYWTTTVEQADAATGTVTLRLRFAGHGEAGFGGQKYVHDQREDGEAVFVRGVMTKLSLSGRESTAYPDRTYTYAISVDTSLQDPTQQR